MHYYQSELILNIFTSAHRCPKCGQLLLPGLLKNGFRIDLGQASCGLTGGFRLLRIFSVAISVSPHLCFILDLILISMFLR